MVTLPDFLLILEFNENNYAKSLYYYQLLITAYTINFMQSNVLVDINGQVKGIIFTSVTRVLTKQSCNHVFPIISKLLYDRHTCIIKLFSLSVYSNCMLIKNYSTCIINFYVNYGYFSIYTAHSQFVRNFNHFHLIQHA